MPRPALACPALPLPRLAPPCPAPPCPAAGSRLAPNRGHCRVGRARSKKSRPMCKYIIVQNIWLLREHYRGCLVHNLSRYKSKQKKDGTVTFEPNYDYKCDNGLRTLRLNQDSVFLDGVHFRQSKGKMYLIFSSAECSWNKYILSLD